MHACLMVLTASLALGAEHFEGHAFYLGDPHFHSGASGDGGSTDLGECEGTCGAIAEVLETARANGLDWMSLTDHVNGNQSANTPGFDHAFATTLAAHDPEGGFVVLPGAELRTDTPDGYLGHKNLYFAASNEQLAAMTLADLRYGGTSTAFDDCQALWTWVSGLSDRWGELMLLAHHPARLNGMGTDWGCQHGELAARFSPAVEIYSRHGGSMDCPAEHDAIPQGCQHGSDVSAALDPSGHALHLGFVAGTDAHDTLPGNTCALDTELPNHAYGGGLTIAVLDEQQDFDRGTLFAAIQTGGTYATSGPFLPVVVDLTASGRRVGGMGETVAVPPGQPLRIELRIPSEHEPAVLAAELVSPAGVEPMSATGAGVYGAEIAAGELPAWVYPRVELDGAVWYGEPCDDGGSDNLEHLWLSPIFLVEQEPDTGDTGGPVTEDTSTDSPPPGDSSEEPEATGCRSSCTQGGPAPAMLLALTIVALGAAVRRERGSGER